MDTRNNIATDLFYKIRSRFNGLKLGAETGEITIMPEEARFFDFDYMEGDTPIGHVSISLAEQNSMKVYFSHGITETMDGRQKENWYGFLKELRMFAKRRMLNFDPRDITKDNLDQRDYMFLSQNAKSASTTPTPIGESIMSESNLYGSKNVSYRKLMDTRLIIKHSKALNDDSVPGSRSRNISALFIENNDGERFKYPFIHLSGAKAMQRHVANEGLPYDDIGRSITAMSEEIAQLKSFGNYVVRNDLMNSDTNGIVERSTAHLNGLRDQLQKLSKQHHYEAYKNGFHAATPVEMPQSVVEEYTDKFTVRNFKEDIASVFPVIYRLMQEHDIEYSDIVNMATETHVDESNELNTVNYLAKFENWAMMLGEQDAITSQDPEEKQAAIVRLKELMDGNFPVGINGENAIVSLKGIIDDPSITRQFETVAKDDPEADAKQIVEQWLEAYAPDVLGELNSNPEEPNDEPSDDLNMEPETEDSEEGQEQQENKSGKHKLQELAEFIHSFYDKDQGTFPKGPEGVCTMVDKKFGEQAGQIARKMCERMAPQQQVQQHDQQHDDMDRMKQLAGILR